MSRRWLIAYVLLLAIALAIGALIIPQRENLDCGPQGKPALNGTACIDREPVTTTQ
jgi:hypothetical protein